MTRRIEIIAELAQGFEGNPAQASLLVRAAARAGADAAKFQMVFADELATPDYKYYELFRSLEMDKATWRSLAEQAVNQGITLQVDVFGRQSLALAAEVGIATVKLHGTDIANPGLLKDVAESDVPRVMLGAGGAHQSEIDSALEALQGKEVLLLLGFQSYPTPTAANQIDRVRHIAARYADRSNVTLGFADHADPSSQLHLALAATAVGAGARVVEKHLTLGRNMELEDFESALNPDEFGEFVSVLRGVAEAMGQAEEVDDFAMSESEASYRKMIRRHVVTAADLPAGHMLAPSDLVLKRSADEAPLTDLDRAIGRRLARAVAANRPLGAGELEG